MITVLAVYAAVATVLLVLTVWALVVVTRDTTAIVRKSVQVLRDRDAFVKDDGRRRT